MVSKEMIEEFIEGQVACWNAHDKDGLMNLYRRMAPNKLEITYAGRDDNVDGWIIMEEMYDNHNDQIKLEVIETIICNNEVAIHHRNIIVGTSSFIESIETYRFENDGLYIKYYLKPRLAEEVALSAFRGFS